MDAAMFTEAMYLAKTIFGEARGEGPQAMRLVAWVIRNRRDHPQKAYGKSIAEVVTAPYQFSCWLKGDPNFYKLANPMRLSEVDRKAWLEAVGIALEVLSADPTTNPLPGVYHYHDTSISPPAWAKQMVPVRVSGVPKLVFYRKEVKPA